MHANTAEVPREDAGASLSISKETDECLLPVDEVLTAVSMSPSRPPIA